LAIRLCDAFPLTANGKVDRERLARQADTGGPVAAAFEPEDELEAEVAEVWRVTLGAAPAAADISFFAAGGDSISAIRLYNRLLAGRVEGTTVLTVFRAPTIRALSALLRDSDGRRDAGAALPPVIATPRDDVCYPATAAQSRLWFEERVAGDGSLYNLCFNVQVTGTVDVAVLEAAFDRIIAAWEILRIAIREGEDGEPVQVLQAPWAFRIQVTDLRSDADKHNRLKALGRAEAETPFVLAEGRPVRAHLVRLSEQLANLVITVHHTAFDGWTFGHFLEVLAASLQGAEIGRPELSSIDYARWEQLAAVEETVVRQTEWWHTHLAETPPCAELSPVQLRAPIRESEGAICTRTLPLDLVAGLTSLSRSADTTPFVTLLAALGVVLGRLTGEDRVLLGTHISLRNQPVLETMPGMMVNNICLTLETGRDAGFVSVLNAAREAVLGGLEHGLAPFNHVVRRMGNWQDTTRHPLYNITFTHENFSNAVLSAGGLTLSHADPFVARSPLDIDLAMADLADGGISLKAVYHTALFSDAMIAALLEAIEAVLVAVTEDTERPLQNIVLALTPLDALLERGEGPHMDIPDQSGIRLFEERVAAAPQDPALLDEAGRTILRFGELSSRVVGAAAHFTASGLQAGDTLAICLPRGEHLVTAMLAAWRCGAHFTAMSAGLPEARIRAIVEDARPRLFVTDRPELAGDVRVSDPGSWLSDVQTGPLADVSKTAALIYTSGSTGVPNGVEFTMAALLNRLHWQWRHYPFTPGESCVARTAVDFVDYLAEIFGPLLAGYPVAVLSDATAGDPAALLAAVGSVRPRRLLMIPSLMDVLLEDTAVVPAQLASIRLWISSGEPLEKRVAERLHGLLPGSVLLNLYGSSETGADVTAAEVAAGADRVGIGSPIANLGTHIVDSAGQPLPAGLPGSILVSGAGLAQGYRNREQLNAQRFIHWHGRRVFCTGDRGIRMADGTIRLLGRSDRQVKIRGQRIELGDVQAVISAVPGVESAAVVLDTAQGRLEILAAFAGTAGQDQVMHTLTRLLPPAARPALCVRLEALPRTPGGKLAYGAVAALVRAADGGDRADALPLVTDTEKRLAVLWQDVLGEQVLHRRSLFHSVGGHSLAAARLAARVTRDFQIVFPIRLVIERNELGDMAAAIDDLAATAVAQTEEFVF
jgi:amino acid adenylation domain-containing protein